MPLIIFYVAGIQHIFIDHFLQLKKRGCLMPAYITKIIRTCTSDRKRFWIFYFLNIYLVKGGVNVILDPEYGGAKKIIIFNQLNKTDRMNFFSPANHFIRSMCVDVLDKVW